MEKTITISGKDVNFKLTGGTLCIYKQQFGREYYNDVLEIKKMNADVYSEIEIYKRKYAAGFRLIWAMAKTADPGLPDPDRWLKSFRKFPTAEILNELSVLFPSDGESDGDGGSFTSESLIACAAACGFTKADVYELSLDFLVNCISEAVDLKSGKKKDRVRKATQQDINNFWG